MPRSRLVRQLVTETLMLAGVGGVVGLAIAQWGGRILRALFLPDVGPQPVVGDGRTLVFTAAITAFIALATALAPALQALRADVAQAIAGRADRALERRFGARPALVLFQGALSMILLVVAGLFVRSLLSVRDLELGYDVDSVVVVEANMRGVRLTARETAALVERTAAAALDVPGVRSATPALAVPFWSTEGRGAPWVPGLGALDTIGFFGMQAGSADYFETVGTRIVRGRGFASSDRGGSLPVVVVSESMAAAIWADGDVLGKQMRIGGDATAYLTVIGIAQNIRARSLAGPTELWYYLPADQLAASRDIVADRVFVRVDGRAADHVESVRARLQKEMPGAAYVSVVPLAKYVDPQQRSWRLGAIMFAGFAALAVAVAGIGLYSVIAFAVATRTRELGVRIALGARLPALARMVVAEGVSFAALGVALGGAVAALAGRWIQPLLFRTSARDPLVYACVAAILLVVAVLATVGPALRAMRIDAAVALRKD
jgi:predicted permease